MQKHNVLYVLVFITGISVGLYIGALIRAAVC
jgi:hypothetical protein